uniref:Uncharacterized protein n=1 Tax=viral metagenome TaxID=1070528 RepID=A0A2V0RII7_9ZZZZ
MSGNSRIALPSQRESEGVRVLRTFRNKQLRSLMPGITGVKCVRQHPTELQPKAQAFTIENVKDLACHVLKFGSPTLKQNFMALTYEYDMFGGVHLGLFCLSVRRGASQTAYLFTPDLDNFAGYIQDQVNLTDDMRITIAQGAVATINYYPTTPSKLFRGIPILFFAQSDSDADLFTIYLMMRYAYYQYPKEGIALEGSDDF